MSKRGNLPLSEHFELLELAEGVYAALGKSGQPDVQQRRHRRPG